MKIMMAPLCSGSSGNSTYIGTEETALLVDAGSTGRALTGTLESLGLKIPSAILVTHEHIDHINAVGVLSRKFGIPVYANAETWQAMEKKLGAIAMRNVRIIDTSEFYIGDICVKPFETSHDAAHSFGYSFYANGAKLTTMTDTGKFTRAMLSEAENSDLMLLESNHDVEMLKNGSYPMRLKERILSGRGHLSNDQAAEAAGMLVNSGVRAILLGHLSLENNTLEAAYTTVKNGLLGNGIVTGKDVALGMTKRESAVGPYRIE